MYSELALFIDGKWLSGEGRKGEDVILSLIHISEPTRPY